MNSARALAVAAAVAGMFGAPRYPAERRARWRNRPPSQESRLNKRLKRKGSVHHGLGHPRFAAMMSLARPIDTTGKPGALARRKWHDSKRGFKAKVEAR